VLFVSVLLLLLLLCGLQVEALSDRLLLLFKEACLDLGKLLAAGDLEQVRAVSYQLLRSKRLGTGQHSASENSTACFVVESTAENGM
jgi:hypothetical protein